MSSKKITLYAIPGWGFCASIFKQLNNDKLNIIGLNYMKAPLSSLNSIAQHLSLELPNNAILLGWSFGGLIAIEIAALFPKKVHKLILISTQPKLTSSDNWLGIESSHATHFIKKLKKNFNLHMEQFIRLISHPTQSSTLKSILHKHLLNQHSQGLISLLSISINIDLRTAYQNLNIDILHIINNKDTIIPQNKKQLQKLNLNAKFINFDKAGHAGFLTNKDCYIKTIMDFL